MNNDDEHLRAIVEPTDADPYYDFRKGKAMTDIVERLRYAALVLENNVLVTQAANEIERLRAALTTYTAANGEELPKGSAGTTIVNDGRPT